MLSLKNQSARNNVCVEMISGGSARLSGFLLCLFGKIFVTTKTIFILLPSKNTASYNSRNNLFTITNIKQRL